jgi:hypothetical protein
VIVVWAVNWLADQVLDRVGPRARYT